MKTSSIASFVLGMAVITANTQALADEHGDHQDEHVNNHQPVHHEEWKKGAKIKDEDWQRGEHVDYRQQHLRAPPRGHEWRQVDGNYVLEAVATGVIASVVVSSERSR